MASATSPFDASASALGYIYQCRLALLLALRKNDDPALTVSIEKIDDITFERDGTPHERIQTKLQVTPGVLSDASEAVWKTLRIWSDDVASGKLKPSETLLCLLSSGTAQSNSALAYLRGDNERNVAIAQSMLEATAAASQNRALKAALASFSNLTQHQRRSLVDAIYILDNSPTAVDLRPLIIHELRLSAEPQHRSALADRLEGWWLDQVITHLSLADNHPIPVQSILRKRSRSVGNFIETHCLTIS